MLHEGAVFKLLLAPAGIWIAADVLPKLVQSGFETIALTAAGLGGLVLLTRWARKGIRGGVVLSRRIHGAIDIVETTPERLDKIEQRLADGEEHFKQLDGHLGVIADADEHRIKDALAGDQRSPIDRRSTAA
jgi:hypothetical protein